MPYITSIERDGEARGETKLIVRLLKRQVGQISEETASKIGELPIEQLEQLGEDLLDFNNSQDLVDWFQHSTKS
jgi:predicted transposase YdaD